MRKIYVNRYDGLQFYSLVTNARLTPYTYLDVPSPLPLEEALINTSYCKRRHTVLKCKQNSVWDLFKLTSVHFRRYQHTFLFFPVGIKRSNIMIYITILKWIIPDFIKKVREIYKRKCHLSRTSWISKLKILYSPDQ